jgi:hypothetical protein
VPRNPRLLVTTPAEVLELRGEDGASIEVDVEPSGVQGLGWARPRTMLEAGMRYTLVTTSDADASVVELEGDVLAITAADRVDHEPVTVGRVHVAAAAGSGNCNLTVGAVVTLASLAAPDHPGSTVYVQLDVTIGDARQRVIMPMPAYAQEQQAEFGLGAAPDPAACLFGRAVPSAAAGESAIAEIAIYDLAGNATVMEPVQFTFGQVEASGCPPATGPPGWNLDAGVVPVAPASTSLGDAGPAASTSAAAPHSAEPHGSAGDEGRCSVIAPGSVRRGSTRAPSVWLGLLIMAWLRRRAGTHSPRSVDAVRPAVALRWHRRAKKTLRWSRSASGTNG